MKPTIAIIGTGLMGSALARALLGNGFPVTVWNRSRDKAEPLAAHGAVVVDAVEEAFAAADLIIVNVSNYEVSGQLLASRDLEIDLGGKIVLEVTSGAPDAARRANEEIAKRDALYLDGAILGTPDIMGTEQAPIVVSGPSDAFERCAPAIRALGNVNYLGSDIGLANAFDVANLSLLWGALFGAVHSVAVCEAEGVSLKLLAQSWGDVEPVIDNMVSDYLTRSEAGRIEADGETLATVGTHFHALENLFSVMVDRGLDRSVVNGYMSLFAKAQKAGKLSADFSSMTQFMRA